MNEKNLTTMSLTICVIIGFTVGYFSHDSYWPHFIGFILGGILYCIFENKRS